MHKYLLVLALLLLLTKSEEITPDPALYCSNITVHCPGQYSDEINCINLASKLVPGSISDMDKDTLGCRLNFTVQSLESSSFCSKAGPLGGGVCGNYCTVFCNYQASICNNTQFEDQAQCMKICEHFNLSHFFPIMNNETVDHVNVTNGNSIECRYHHLINALKSEDPVMSCKNSGPDGGEVCGKMTENYKYQLSVACSEYVTEGFDEMIGLLPLGTIGDVSVNSLFCRTHFIRKSIITGERDLNCKKASILTSEVEGCGTACEVYCSMVKNIVDCQNLYSSDENCMSSCSNFRNGNLGEIIGNTIQCRLKNIATLMLNETKDCSHIGPNSTSCVDTSEMTTSIEKVPTTSKVPPKTTGGSPRISTTEKGAKTITTSETLSSSTTLTMVIIPLILLILTL